MKYVKAFYRFWYDFIVGDDWRLAVGAGSALGASALFVHFGVRAWWFLPLATVGLLALSVRRGTRARH